MAELTAQDYKAALNAALLYIQSITADINNKGPLPSERSIKLLAELGANHNEAMTAISRSR